MSDAARQGDELIALRRHLHTRPELSGRELETARLVTDHLRACGAREVLTGLGGHGVAGVFGLADPAFPSIMLRCELDALPLPEAPDCAWPSQVPDCAHKCGHDGHMAILLGVARRLQDAPPVRGRIILLFQPAEETATGAAALLADTHFCALDPDWIFALHNLPGYPAWQVLSRPGVFAAGGCRLRIHFPGPQPEAILEQLLPQLVNLNSDRAGRPALVIVNNEDNDAGSLWVSLRATEDRWLHELQAEVRALAADLARDRECESVVEVAEQWPVTRNDSRAVALIEKAAAELDLETASPGESPFQWAEDFGRLTAWRPGAMLGLGAGENHPALHARDYEFPDDLILPGVTLLHRLCRIAM